MKYCLTAVAAAFFLICVSPVAAQEWRTLLDRADSLAAASEVDSALATGLAALDLARDQHGPADSSVAAILRRMSVYHYYKGEYDQAESMARQCLEIREAVFGPDHPEVAIALRTLGVMLIQQSKYTEAEDSYLRALGIFEQDPSSEPVEIAALLDNLGILHFYYTGDLEKALSRYEQSLEIKWAIDSLSSDVALTMNNIGEIHRFRGEFIEADLMLRGALMRFRATLPEGHSNIADVLDVLALVNSELRKYDRAEELSREALAIRENNFDPNHPDLISTLDALALALANQGEFEDAERQYQRAIAIAQGASTDQREAEALVLNNLGNLYTDRQRYADAMAVYQKSLEVKREMVGDQHPWIASTLLNMGNAAFYLDDLATAEQSLEQSMTILDRVYRGFHRDHADVLGNLSKVRRVQGRLDEAFTLADQAFEIQQDHFVQNAIALSEQEALKYSHDVRQSAGNLLSCASETRLEDTAVGTRLATVMLTTKGAVSEEAFRRLRAVRTQPDSVAAVRLDSLRAVRRELSSLFVAGPDIDSASFAFYLDTLGTVVRGLEESLARSGVMIGEVAPAAAVTPESVTAALPPEAALVEYYRYDFIDTEQRTSRPAYAAVVLTQDGGTTVVDLGAAQPIDSLLTRYRRHMLDCSLQIFGLDEFASEYQDISQALYQSIWQPIAEAIGDAELVFVAPDGALTMLSFAGLQMPDNRYLIEKHTLHYLTAGRDLLRPTVIPVSTAGLLALGDPDFDATVSERKHATDAINRSAGPTSPNRQGFQSPCDNIDDITVSALPGTRDEIARVATRWSESASLPVMTLLGRRASEESFKQAAALNRMLHLATHGYYLQTDCESTAGGVRQEIALENPLLLSGLFLAGANLHGAGATESNTEDGVLTAYEVAEMRLDSTQLVVLSACETGLGEVYPGEGVYGLRRAFLMAGAGTVVCALWPISDETTAELISPLYGGELQSIPMSLRRVQLDAIRLLRENGQSDHPYQWASFIAIGNHEL